MNLTLTPADQQALIETGRVMASPLSFETEDTWIDELVLRTRSCLGAAVCSFQMPRTNGIPLLGAGLEEKQIVTYRGYEPLLQETRFFERLGDLRVATREDAYGPHYEAILASPYNQEFLRSIGTGESLSLAVPLVPRPRRQQDIVQLLLNKEFGEPPFDREAVQKAHLLYPAFEAGVRTLMRHDQSTENGQRLLERGGGACAVFSRTGFLQHATSELDALLDCEPLRDQLMASVRALAGRLKSNANGSLPSADNLLEDQFDGARGRYSLAASLVNGLGRSTEILVSVSHPEKSGSPSDETLRDRFGLTPQEVRVARLLAERRTNREIADALAISVHTARHHVRHTLEKVGVPRREVESVLTA